MKNKILYQLFLIISVNVFANNKHMDTLYHFTILSDTTKIKYIELTNIEAFEKIKQFNGIPNLEFSNSISSDVYKLNDGKYIVIGKRACYLYFSRNDIIKIIFTGVRSEHILYNLNIYGKDFPNHVSDAIDKMCSSLKFNKSDLNYTEESLNYIDNKFVIEDMRSYVIVRRNIIGLIAYAGKVFIKKYGGEWNMVLASDGETWQPFIKVKNNDNFDLYVWVYDSLVEFQGNEYPSISVGYFTKTDSLFKKKK